MPSERKNAIYSLLTGDDEGRVCRDIPEEACHEQSGNFIKHIISLASTKTGDGLADPKLVLSWLLSALGASPFFIGLLVPIREAGALLPQLFTAATIRSLPQRKWAWAAGSVVQGLSVAGMALAALFLEGSTAGWTIVSLLALFAVARSVCSVSYKDVLGKTVSKATRGTATGSAGTVAAILVLLFGILLSLGIIDKSVNTIAVVLMVAGGLWLISAGVFVTLAEVPGATGGGRNALGMVGEQLSLLKSDRQLVRFIITRGLLIATALAPPYLIALSGHTGGRQFGQLGPFVVASGLAAVTSSFFWGRLSDNSSRMVLILAGLVGAVALGVAAALGIFAEDLLAGTLVLPVIHYILMMAHQGVRLGRSTHIVDMAGPDKRASYTALSNTIIGILLVLGGVFGAVAQAAGETAVLAIFALMAIAASLVARTLDDVQAESK